MNSIPESQLIGEIFRICHYRGLTCYLQNGVILIKQQGKSMILISINRQFKVSHGDIPIVCLWTTTLPTDFNFGTHTGSVHLISRNLAIHICNNLLNYDVVSIFANTCHCAFYETIEDIRNLIERIFENIYKFYIEHRPMIRIEHQLPDLIIEADVYLNDCYKIQNLKDRYIGNVVDIGANIGAFARIVNDELQASKIICVEADRQNFPMLKHNSSGYATLINKACYYSDSTVKIFSTVFPDTNQTGGTYVTDDENRDPGEGVYYDAGTIETITLEEIMETNEIKKIDLLKLDCEGSEINILGKTNSLDKINIIVGEWHNKQMFNQLVEDRFQDWKLKIWKGDEIGLFWLISPNYPLEIPKNLDG